jgi:hypothetical protein
MFFSFSINSFSFSGIVLGFSELVFSELDCSVLGESRLLKFSEEL